MKYLIALYSRHRIRSAGGSGEKRGESCERRKREEGAEGENRKGEQRGKTARLHSGCVPPTTLRPTAKLRQGNLRETTHKLALLAKHTKNLDLSPLVNSLSYSFFIVFLCSSLKNHLYRRLFGREQIPKNK